MKITASIAQFPRTQSNIKYTGWLESAAYEARENTRTLRKAISIDMRVRVQCYAGTRADERPIRFWLDDRGYFVEAVLDQWYGPDAMFFKVRADDGNLYILRRDSSLEDAWSLEAFRHA